MDTIEIASGGALVFASAKEASENFRPSGGKAIVCLVPATSPWDEQNAEAIELLLSTGCDYFAFFGMYSSLFHNEADFLIESRAPVYVKGRGEFPAHATTAEIDGTLDDVAAIFLHSAGAASTSRNETVWLTLIGSDAHDVQLRAALVRQAGA